MKLVARHAPYLLCGALFGSVIAWGIAVEDAVKFVSTATAYASLVYMATALLIGPWRVLSARRPIASHSMRRRLGIWAGLFGIAHMLAGLNSHFKGKMWNYFVFPNGDGPLGFLRTDLFGVANYLGVVGIVVLIMLLALSNDSSIKRLGVTRWKSAQRFTYLLFALIVLHAFAYYALEARHAVILVFVGLVSTIVIIMQALGFFRYLSSASRDN